MAVATGVADVVVCLPRLQRALREPVRPVLASPRPPRSTPTASTTPGPTRWGSARRPRRSRCRRAATCTSTAPPPRTSARVAVADRRHAATNPDAFFYEKPITLEDHQASRMIVDPLHLLDCCQESDGAVALVVTSAERARDLRQTPAVRRRGRAGERRRPVRDDVVLPRRHRHPRDGRGRPRAVAPVGARARRHADGDPLRPLHAVRPDAARGARLLRPRRGARTSSPTARSRSAAGCRSTPTAASSARPTSTA